jgi:two-component system response regulator YesN
MFRMIIVEDEPRILRHLKEKITDNSSDFKVIGTYDNGEDALIELHWTQPHAIITDIRMPVMDGLELIHRVKKKLPEIQCAIISGHDDFQYLRQGIKLGVTDYLLKPASDSDIQQLLEQMKEKIFLNQRLLEGEVASQISGVSTAPGSSLSNWSQIAKELFYHGHYILVYAWQPQGDIPAGIESRFENLLKEGEKHTSLPSTSGNERILLFGVHSCSPGRQDEWMKAVENLVVIEAGVTISMALSEIGIQPIPDLLDQCKREVRVQSRFGGCCFWLSDSTPENIQPLLEPYQPITQRLAQFVIKQQKQLFCKELDLLIAREQTLQVPETRKGWEQLLLFISHSLHNQSKDYFSTNFETMQAMEAELSEEVWRLKQINELFHQIREIWCSYFFKAENEQTTNRDWAKDAKQYIHIYYNENISLTSIADNLQLNQAYLNRLFKKAYQTSIPDYLVKIRMEEAGRFIKEHPFVLIKEIAEHVGYLDPFHFSKAFKQYTGFSPSDYKTKRD